MALWGVLLMVVSLSPLLLVEAVVALFPLRLVVEAVVGVVLLLAVEVAGVA
jgi:hypothetical protein